MDAQRREELVKRRERWHDQRQQQQIDEAVRRFLKPIDAAGVRYVRVANDLAVEWLSSHFAVNQYAAIEWVAVDEMESAPATKTDLTTWFTAVAALKQLGNPEVVVLQADGQDPTLQMRLDEFIRHAELLVDTTYQTWVFAPTSNWVIQFHHDGDWTWARSFKEGR